VESGLRRVPVQQRSRDKVERALQAADALLEREGVTSLTLSRVAEEAGVSVGALYQYLPDREAIVGALSSMYYARLEARMDELIAGLTHERSADPVGEVIEAIAQMYRGQSATRALRAGLQGADQLALGREHKQRMVAKVQVLLVAYGIVPDGAGDTVARTIFFAADGVMHEVFAADEQGDADLLAELEVMLRVYLGGA
jgi:AcrR family transcriptional regulator